MFDDNVVHPWHLEYLKVCLERSLKAGLKVRLHNEDDETVEDEFGQILAVEDCGMVLVIVDVPEGPRDDGLRECPPHAVYPIAATA